MFWIASALTRLAMTCTAAHCPQVRPKSLLWQEEGVEFVAHPGAHGVFGLKMADGRAGAKGKWGRLRKTAKIRIAVSGA